MLAATEREPRMCPLEQGRTLGGVYSRLEQEHWGCILGTDNMETDRTFEIVNLRKKCAWGAFFPQIDDCQRSVCHPDAKGVGSGPTS